MPTSRMDEVATRVARGLEVVHAYEEALSILNDEHEA